MRLCCILRSAQLSLPAAAALALTGCTLSPTAAPTPATGAVIHGKAFGGQQPLRGAHVYLFAANSGVTTPNTSGYGNPSISLLDVTKTGHSDSVGAYVLTGSDGSFSITNDYSCSPNTQAYIYVLGGDAGDGNNSAIGLLGALGACPGSDTFVTNFPNVQINEVTTVAAAYALAGFATDATDISSSSTTLAQTNLANAFLNAATLANVTNGAANTSTSANNGTVPQQTIDMIANILAACVNTAGPGSTACSTLFSNAMSSSSTPTAPTDTASAAINMAHNPSANVGTLAGIITADAPFPTPGFLTPSDLTLALTYSGGGISSPIAIAIDGSGDAWIVNHSGSTITELSSTGTVQSGTSGYSAPSILQPEAIAIDRFGRAWIANFGTACVTELSSTGGNLSGSSGYTGGNSINMPYGIAIDANGYVWVTDYGSSKITRLQGNGAVNGYYTVGGGNDKPYAIAIDGNDNAWVTEWNAGVTELNNSGTVLADYTGGGLNEPESIAIDHGGDAFAGNYIGNSLTEITAGAAVSNIPSGFSRPESVVIDGGGNVWAANYSNNSIIEQSTVFSAAAFNEPDAIAIDGSGDVWVANTGAYTVVELIGAAVPVVTPIAYGVYTNTVASLP
jgi:streptogramin lyase